MLGEVARLFLKLGFTAFGGPAAHIAMMEDEVVRRRGWISRERFLDLLGATNLIPGPNSTEMAIHLGFLRAGWPGLLVAGACFILPAVAIVLVLAWAYVRFGALPQVAGVLYGVKPVVVAVVAQAILGLGRTAVKDVLAGLVLVAALAASLLGMNELVILAAAGVLVAAARGARRASSTGSLPLLVPFGLGPLFLVCLKIGSVLFGSGYVLLAFLRADFVQRLGWLTDAQLLDAVAIGQVTPGPVFTTVTFVGYLLGGPTAALVATLGIFAPAFVFVALSGPLVPRLRRSPIAGGVLDGVNVASLGLMTAVTWRLGADALVDPLTVLLLVVAVGLLVRFRVSTSWLILGGAAVGLLRSVL